MKSICIISHLHLASNPRVVKEANTLAKNGYKVTILTIFSSKSLFQRDLKLLTAKNIEYKGVVDIIPNNNNIFVRLKERLITRVAKELNYRFNFQTPQSLSYGYAKILKKAKGIRADLYIAHLELGFCVGYKLLQEGFKVGFDFEDWYSNDLLPNAQNYRPIALLEKVEKMALQKGTYTITTSKAMANAIATAYNANKPKIIYNLFPKPILNHNPKDRKNNKILSLFWYSQTIGPGRGLELILKSLALVQSQVQLHLRGNISANYKQDLEQQYPYKKGHLLFFHPQVPAEELPSRIAEHDIGLALEAYTPQSRNYTITNKVFQYLQSGLAVIATDTAGQKEAQQLASGSIFLFTNNQIEALAKLVEKFATNKELLKNAKKEALEISGTNLNWEEEEKKFLSIIKTALNHD